jgi:hypothetical protein
VEVYVVKVKQWSFSIDVGSMPSFDRAEFHANVQGPLPGNNASFQMRRVIGRALLDPN